MLINIKMDSYHLESNTKVVQNQILKQETVDIFWARAWHRNGRGLGLKWPQFIDGMFDLSGTSQVVVGDHSSNCSSKMKSIDKTTWLPEAKNLTERQKAGLT